MKLSLEQFKALARAIADGFDQPELTSLLQLEIGKVLANLVPLPCNWGPLVTQVVKRAEMEEFTAELVLAVATWRPRNAAFAKVLRELTQAPGEGHTLALSISALGTATSNSAALQGKVRAVSQYANVEQFHADLATASSRVCRIEAAGQHDVAYGTGVLVGNDLVLTNQHVRERLMHDNASPACRFDYRQLAGSVAVRDGTLVGAPGGADTWVAWRPYAPSDVVEGGRQPTADELDYALLRLVDRVSHFPTGRSDALSAGQPRGHFQLLPTALPLAVDEDIFVLQHPAGSPQKLAVGRAQYSAGPLRTAHDAPTEGGTSGSPCLDVLLQLRALHHATDPLDPQRPRFNQAVPIGLIAADLASRGKL